MEKELPDVEDISIVTAGGVCDMATFHNAEMLRVLLNRLRYFIHNCQRCENKNEYTKFFKETTDLLKDDCKAVKEQQKIDDKRYAHDLDRSMKILLGTAFSIKNTLF